MRYFVNISLYSFAVFFCCVGHSTSESAERILKSTSLAGGEDCATATVIAALPFSDTGSTVGAMDDYDEACSWASTSGDHVYAYTPAADMAIDVSLCDSLYDTKVYIYEGACPGTVVACNDDAGCGITGYQSELKNISLRGGTTYYIVVDGYGGATGDYVIDVEEVMPCVVDCPPEAEDEGEACGDGLNNGCTMFEPAFTAIECGDTLCANGWAQDGTHDIDWYELVIIQTMWITLTVDAEFDVIAGIVETSTPGSGECSDYTGDLQEYAEADACESAIVEALLTPGTYWFSVESTDFYGYPCADGPWDYTINLDCIPGCTDMDQDDYSIEGGECGLIDCNDSNPLIYPEAEEVCDGMDNDCDGEIDEIFEDVDEDDWANCLDCDDSNADTYPGANELCDGLDNDCSGLPDPNEVDADTDSFMICAGDCDDADVITYPGAEEICDSRDNNCDGFLPNAESDFDSDAFMECEGDCDDYNPSTYPDAFEVCDEEDNDCDGSVPEDEFDNDGDSWIVCAGDCDDSDADINPEAEEFCGDDIDNNCDGLTDIEDEVSCPCTDVDGDGYSQEHYCGAVDCNDENNEIHPGHPEVPDNGIDDNCNGQIDEGCFIMGVLI